MLRHWEDAGLLRPRRDSAGRRRYADDDSVRIAVILRNKAAGLSLDQIRVLLDEEAPDRHRVLQEHIVELERRSADILRARAMTEHALHCRAHDITQCGRFRSHVDDVLAGAARWSVPDDRGWTPSRGEGDESVQVPGIASAQVFRSTSI